METIMSIKEKIIKYIWNNLLAFDRQINALLCGDPEETLSSRMGKLVEQGRCPFCFYICTHFLHKLDPNHCQKSIDRDEGDDEIKF